MPTPKQQQLVNVVDVQLAPKEGAHEIIEINNGMDTITLPELVNGHYDFKDLSTPAAIMKLLPDMFEQTNVKFSEITQTQYEQRMQDILSHRRRHRRDVSQEQQSKKAGQKQDKSVK